MTKSMFAGIKPQEVMDVAHFNYGMLAELFIGRGRGAKQRTITYRRFAKGADAIRFVIEELPAAKLVATVLEVDESRFYCREIRELYDSPDYPLQRRALSQREVATGITRIARTDRRARSIFCPCHNSICRGSSRSAS